jgi:hypothetical protein
MPFVSVAPSVWWCVRWCVPTNCISPGDFCNSWAVDFGHRDGPTYTGKWITSTHKIDCPQIAIILWEITICGQSMLVTVTKIDCPQIAKTQKIFAICGQSILVTVTKIDCPQIAKTPKIFAICGQSIL